MNYFFAHAGFEISVQSRKSLEGCGVRRIEAPSQIDESIDICFCFYVDPGSMISHHYQNNDEDVFATTRFYRNFLSHGGSSLIFLPYWSIEHLDISDPQVLVEDAVFIQNKAEYLPPVNRFGSVLLRLYREKYPGLFNIYQEMELLASRGNRLPDLNYSERVLSVAGILSFDELKGVFDSDNFNAGANAKGDSSESPFADLQKQNLITGKLVDSLIEEVNSLESDRRSYSKVLETYVASSANIASILGRIMKS